MYRVLGDERTQLIDGHQEMPPDAPRRQVPVMDLASRGIAVDPQLPGGFAQRHHLAHHRTRAHGRVRQAVRVLSINERGGVWRGVRAD